MQKYTAHTCSADMYQMLASDRRLIATFTCFDMIPSLSLRKHLLEVSALK